MASAATSNAVGGQTKHACSVGVGGSGRPDSDETEDGMGTDSDEIEDDEEDMDVGALVACVTIVFEGNRSNTLPGYILVCHSYSLRTVLTTFIIVYTDPNMGLICFG